MITEQTNNYFIEHQKYRISFNIEKVEIRMRKIDIVDSSNSKKMNRFGKFLEIRNKLVQTYHSINKNYAYDAVLENIVRTNA